MILVDCMENFVNRTLLTSISAVLLAAVVLPEVAHAQEASQDGVVENVVVRNRRYSAQGTVEVSPSVGFTLANRFTSHTNLQLGIAYNAWETFGFELRGGYAINGLSSVATQVQDRLYELDPLNPDNVGAQTKDDFEDLWRLQWSAFLLPRWMPIYGKLNLATELPIHFQAYLTAGPGYGGFKRESLVYCQNGVNSDAARPAPKSSGGTGCRQYLTENQTGPAIAAGGGMRFFFNNWAQLKLEVMDISYPDQYRENISRVSGEAEQPGSAPTNAAKNTGHGLTNLLFLNVGTTFSF
jgi:outer membrane beta-barrel protein